MLKKRKRHLIAIAALAVITAITPSYTGLAAGFDMSVDENAISANSSATSSEAQSGTSTEQTSAEQQPDSSKKTSEPSVSAEQVKKEETPVSEQKWEETIMQQAADRQWVIDPNKGTGSVKIKKDITETTRMMLIYNRENIPVIYITSATGQQKSLSTQVDSTSIVRLRDGGSIKVMGEATSLVSTVVYVDPGEEKGSWTFEISYAKGVVPGELFFYETTLPNDWEKRDEIKEGSRLEPTELYVWSIPEKSEFTKTDIIEIIRPDKTSQKALEPVKPKEETTETVTPRKTNVTKLLLTLLPIFIVVGVAITIFVLFSKKTKKEAVENGIHNKHKQIEKKMKEREEKAVRNVFDNAKLNYSDDEIDEELLNVQASKNQEQTINNIQKEHPDTKTKHSDTKARKTDKPENSENSEKSEKAFNKKSLDNKDKAEDIKPKKDESMTKKDEGQAAHSSDRDVSGGSVKQESIKQSSSAEAQAVHNPNKAGGVKKPNLSMKIKLSEGKKLK